MADYTPSQSIDHLIEDLKDWRGKRLSRLRKLILEAAPDLTEDWKWETPVWVFNGNVVACGVFKDYVKVNFFKGASLPDPKKMFNAGLDAKSTRAIDIFEDDIVNELNLKELVRAAVALNTKGNKKK